MPARRRASNAVTSERSGAGRAIGAIVALALVAITLWLARPAQVWELVISVRPTLLALAAAAALVAVAFRGLRLIALLPAGRLGPLRGVAMAAVAQAAATFVPARLGELALPALLRRVTGHDFSAGVGTLLATRTFDLAALGAWVALAMAALTGGDHRVHGLLAALLLLLPPVLLPPSIAIADRAVTRCLAPRGARLRRWARRVRRVRREIDRLASRRGRLAVAFAASLAMWAALWTLAWLLLAAMGYHWSWWTVSAGSAVASGSNLLPVNLVGNLGTLEAGWTAAFALLGIPLEVAAATGLACHLWSLVFIAAYGVVGWIAIGRGSGPSAQG